MIKIINSKQNFWKVSALIFAVFLVLSLAGNIWLSQRVNFNRLQNNIQASLKANTAEIKTASAKEIYPLFICPCCGKTIDQCTCPMAGERKNYIDVLIEANKSISEDEVMLAYVKKYGLDSFKDKQRQEEFRQKLVKEAPADRSMISITPDSYDFGDVSQKEGKVYTHFDLKNEGKSDLVIDRLETSCGCTFVSIVLKGEESPFFTMPGHGYENPEWTGVVILPGETAQLKVMYDPDIHKDFRGAAIREIYVFSNDPIDFEKKVKIELNQVD